MVRLPAIIGEGIGLLRLLKGIAQELRRLDREIELLKKAKTNDCDV